MSFVTSLSVKGSFLGDWIEFIFKCVIGMTYGWKKEKRNLGGITRSVETRRGVVVPYISC